MPVSTRGRRRRCSTSWPRPPAPAAPPPDVEGRNVQEHLEESVAQALLNGASVRAVAEMGLSPNTVQKYGRAHGWPTEENRARFYESRWDRDEREDRASWNDGPTDRLQSTGGT